MKLGQLGQGFALHAFLSKDRSGTPTPNAPLVHTWTDYGWGAQIRSDIGQGWADTGQAAGRYRATRGQTQGKLRVDIGQAHYTQLYRFF